MSLTLPVSLASPSVPAVVDAGFESPSVGPGGYRYGLQGTSWIYTGTAGLSGNGSELHRCQPRRPRGGPGRLPPEHRPLLPAGRRLGGRDLHDPIRRGAAGQRPDGRQDFRVLVDGAFEGAIVGTFTPAGTSYATYVTTPFTVAAGTHTIFFQGLNTAGGDNTAFVDAVQIVQFPSVPAVVGRRLRVAVGGRRQLRLPVRRRRAPPGPTPAAPASRATAAASPPATPTPPRARRSPSSRAAARSARSIAGMAAGSYQLTFARGQRGNFQAARQDFRVLVDGVAVGTFTPAGTGYAGYATAAFTVTAGQPHDRLRGARHRRRRQHRLRRRRPDRAAPVRPGGVDAGFESPSVGAGSFAVRPGGDPLDLRRRRRRRGQRQRLHRRQPRRPRGRPGRLPPGRRLVQPGRRRHGRRHLPAHLPRRAARQLPAAGQDFRVLVDGVAVGTFTPAGTGYAALHDGRVHRAGGQPHDRLRRLDTAGGDNTAFVDAVQIVQRGRRARRCRTPAFESPSVGAAASSTPRRGPPGPTPAAPASRATAPGSPPPTPTPPRAPRSPSSRARLVQPGDRRHGRRQLPAQLPRGAARQLPAARKTSA